MVYQYQVQFIEMKLYRAIAIDKEVGEGTKKEQYMLQFEIIMQN